MTGIKMKFFNFKKQKGFTLIEMIVVMAVFMFVIGAAVTIFISIVKEQKEILAEQELINQTSYVIEYMSKALRMAEVDSNGDCLQDDSGIKHGGWIYMLTLPDTNTGFYRGIRFLNASNSDICQEFFLDIDESDPDNPQLILKELKSSDSVRDPDYTHAVALTSTKLKIGSIKFGINGGTGKIGEARPDDTTKLTSYASNTDISQPRVTISFEAEVGSRSSEETEAPTKKIQTTVSQRNLNKK